MTVLAAIAPDGFPQSANTGTWHTHKDLVYGAVAGRALALDLHLPESARQAPLLVWVHKGIWQFGSKDDMPAVFVENGIATASVGYRLAGEAQFPAQVHDIKAAIRFLRAHAAEFGYRAERIGIGGESSGAHLAALVGTTNGHPELEGTIGDHRGESSAVQAVLDYFGPTNFMTILAQSTPHGLKVRVPAFDALLGGQPDALPDLARLASPVLHVNADAPPLLIVHGNQDPQVPIRQSEELAAVYRQHGRDVHFEVIDGAGHGGDEFYDARRRALALAFLHRALGAE